jgi:hypothetical protein
MCLIPQFDTYRATIKDCYITVMEKVTYTLQPKSVVEYTNVVVTDDL